MKKLKLKRKPPQEGPKKGERKIALPPRTLLLLGLLGAGALGLLLLRPSPTPKPSYAFPQNPPPPPVVQTVPQEPPLSTPQPVVETPKAVQTAPSPPPAPKDVPAPTAQKPIPKNPFRLLEKPKAQKPPPSRPAPLPPPPGALPPLPPPPEAPKAERETPKLLALATPSPPGRPVAVLSWGGKTYSVALGERVKGLGKLVRVEPPCATLKEEKALKICLKEE